MDGLMHYYYGNGKGKTTAALGLALRACGCGKRVVIVQFLKNWKCGELSSLDSLPDVTVFRGMPPHSKFVFEMSDEEKVAVKALHDKSLVDALELVRNGLCDLLILDEAEDAYSLGVLDQGLFMGLIADKPKALELVVTGHGADASIIGAADYVTEMVKRKHPYDEGVKARKGIEF